MKPSVQDSPPHPKTSIVSGDQNMTAQNVYKQIVRYTTTIEKETHIAFTVAPKEASHQTPLTLPNSVGSAEMKNYRKGKKQAVCHLHALERGMGYGILDTELWLQVK